MDYRVSYEHSMVGSPNQFISQISSQLVTGVPANIPRALLAEFITALILKRSPQIAKIRNLRVF